jgi:hypothetical protein
MTIKFKILGYTVASIEMEYDLTPNVVKPVSRLIKGISERWTARLWE